MEYRALGPLSAGRAEQNAALGGPKQRMVLALLLVHANRVVSVDRLIDGIWEENPPKAARHTLHGYVSELRKVLDGAPARVGSGYQLSVDTDSFDVLCFESLVDSGKESLSTNPARAADLLDSALALWSGSPYSDLGYEPALENEIRRLAELRLTAVEDRIEANLRAGRHREVTGELGALVREHPYRERLWEQLMLAFYRSGRQTESLRAYTRLRSILSDEFGIDPSAAVQDLEERILRQDPSLLIAASAEASEVVNALGSIRGYELRRVIASNDRAKVYEAFQPSSGRQVALKWIGPEVAGQPWFVQRFEATQQFVAQLNHPHIAPLYDFWRDIDGACLVWPFIARGSLAEDLRRSPWSGAASLRLLDQVGSAVAHAHRQRIVHGRLTASSILVDAAGDAFLYDFESSQGEFNPQVDIVALASVARDLLGHRTDSRVDLSPEVAAVLESAAGQTATYDRVEDFLRDLRRALGADVSGLAVDLAGATGSGIRNPYKGLRAFQETDAADYHGRLGLVDDLIAAVASRRLVAVVGPSGSGKSSVIRAGMVPALRRGAIPGSEKWLITDMYPGTHPFEELETALMRVAIGDPSSINADLLADDRGLLRVVKLILPGDDSQLVLIIDQFEEVFSLVTDEGTRRLLLESLATVVTSSESNVRIVLSLRADFFDRPLAYPEFGELLRDGLVTVVTPDKEALAVAISRPARSVGLDLEPGLVVDIVNDVAGQPGGLPLLQYALSELFHRREGAVLTLAGYHSSGGVPNALGRRAEEIFGGLSAAGQEAARQLFLRLVNAAEDHGGDTRRRVRQSELNAIAIDQPVLDDVIRQFASYRLLTFDRDPVSRNPTVEVAHEALIRGWVRLAGWVDGVRADLVAHRRFTASLQEWEDSDRADAFLMTGGRLAHFEEWADETNISLTETESAFLTTSQSEAARRRRRRLVLLWGTAAALLLLALAAILQSRVAHREARTATVRELAGQARLALSEDPERSILLALEAVGLTSDVGQAALPEAVGALNDAVQMSRLDGRLGGGMGNVAIAPDSSLIATDALDPATSWISDEVMIWDADGNLLRTIQAGGLVSIGNPKPGIEGGRSLVFNPEGDRLAGALESAPGRSNLVVWNPRTGEEVTRFQTPGQVAWSPIWAEHGDWLVAASTNGSEDSITMWNVASGRGLYTISPGFIGEVALYDDRTLVVTHGPEERIAFYELSTGKEIDSLPTPGLAPVYLAVDIGGGRLAVSARHDYLEVWDVESRARLWSRAISSSRRITINPSGALLALTGAEGLVRLLDLQTGAERIELAGHNSAVGDIAFDADGSRLVSVGNDGETRLWSVVPSGSPELGGFHVESGRPFLLDFSPDGRELGISTWEGTYERRAVETGNLVGLLEGFVSDAVVNPVVSPNWKLIAGVDTDRGPVIRDLHSGGVVATLPQCANPRGFSPDGALLVVDTGFLCGPGAGTTPESYVMEVASGQEVLGLGRRVIFRAAFSPGGTFEAGRYLAVNADTTVLEVYDTASRTKVASFEVPPTLLRFDPSGRYLATGTLDGRVVVLDLVALDGGVAADDAVVIDMNVAPGGIPGIAITSDGILAASAFDSPFIQVWDIHRRELLAELHTGLEGSSPPHLNFSPDGAYLIYPDAGNILRRFELDADRLVHLAESRVFRSLTSDECRRYFDPTGCG